MARGHYTSIGQERGERGGRGGGGERGERGGRSGWGGRSYGNYYGGGFGLGGLGLGYGSYGYGWPSASYGYAPSYSYAPGYSYARPAFDISDNGYVFSTGQYYVPSSGSNWASSALPYYGAGSFPHWRSPRHFMNRHRRRLGYLLGAE